MSCNNPLVAVNLGVGSNGKNIVKIFSKYRLDESSNLEERYGRENVLYLPCGKCEPCKLAYRSAWSVRCQMEAMMHKDNCFITLTYDEKNYKNAASSDLIKFFKRLRKAGYKFRYFACSERGELNGRLHHHACLFGYFPSDVVNNSKKSHSDEIILDSEELRRIWGKGIVTVQEFTSRTAGYVAGYTSKKICSDNKIYMSRRPGLGFDYMVENLDRLFKYQCFVGPNGKKYSLPRYFESICEYFNYDFISIKNAKRETMFKLIDNELLEKNLAHQRELFGKDKYIMKDKLNRLKRSL